MNSAEEEYRQYIKSLLQQAENVPALQRTVDQNIQLARYVKAAHWLIDEANKLIHTDQFPQLFVVLTQLVKYVLTVLTVWTR
jgi:hypothetical protein